MACDARKSACVFADHHCVLRADLVTDARAIFDIDAHRLIPAAQQPFLTRATLHPRSNGVFVIKRHLLEVSGKHG